MGVKLKQRTFYTKSLGLGLAITIIKINDEYATHLWYTTMKGFHGRRTTKIRHDNNGAFIQKGGQKHYLNEFMKGGGLYQ